MKALTVLVFIFLVCFNLPANPLDYNDSQCKRARDMLFQSLGDPKKYILDCQLNLLKGQPNDTARHEKVLYKCIEQYWAMKLRTIKLFNKYKCYLAKPE